MKSSEDSRAFTTGKGEYAQHPTEIRNNEEMPAPSVGIFDEPLVCLRINDEWLSLVMGRLEIFTREDFWQGDETERKRAAQEAEKWLACMSCYDCQDFISDIRIGAKGQIQVKKNGAWENANGDGGDTTVVNDLGDIINQIYPPAPPNEQTEPDTRACGVAVGLIDWIWDKFDDSLDIIDAAIDTVFALDAVLALFPPAYIVADEASDIIGEIIEATTESLRALMTTETKEALYCAVYCVIKEDGAIDETNVADVKLAIEDILTGSLLLPTFGSLLLDGIDTQALIQRGMLYQDVGNAINCELLCDNCGLPCWSAPNGATDFDFASTQPRWMIKSGHYDAGTNTIQGDWAENIEVWFSLVKDALDLYDPLNSPFFALGCPFTFNSIDFAFNLREGGSCANSNVNFEAYIVKSDGSQQSLMNEGYPGWASYNGAGYQSTRHFDNTNTNPGLDTLEAEYFVVKLSFNSASECYFEIGAETLSVNMQSMA